MAHDQQHILDTLAEQARQLKLGRPLPAGPLGLKHIEQVVADFNTLLAQPGVTIAAIAEQMGEGFSRGTLSRFRNLREREDADRFGDLDAVARGVNAFMEQLAGRAEASRPEGFVETEVAKRMLAVIQKTAELQAISLIVSDAGRGKSMTLRAAAGVFPGAILVRVIQGARTPKQLAVLLAQKLNLRGVRSAALAEAAIIEKLKGTGRMLLIDEAHQLRAEALEFLRDLHDEAGLPIVLAGTVKLSEKIDDTDLFFGQFSSRVALRYNIAEDLKATTSGGGGGGSGGGGLHSVAEIRELFERDKVRLTADAAELLKRIANLPGFGGLRLCAKLVQVAAAVAQGEPIDARLIHRVIRAMHGRDFATRQLAASLEREAGAVAVA